MDVFNIIMAGGCGTRFWPVSTEHNPKQYINLSGQDAMINETIDRVKNITSKENLYIITNKNQNNILTKTIGDRCLYENIISEPMMKNTAPAILLAALKIAKRNDDGIMCVYPSDHYIKDEKRYNEILLEAIKIARKHDKLVTIGISPTYPSTGYGYIKFDENQKQGTAYNVVQFIEKPNYEKAQEYVSCGDYLWNGGIFVYKASKIIEEFKRYLPKIYLKLYETYNYLDTEDEEKMIEKAYLEINSISIDYGIMERSSDVVVIAGDFGWNDVGSWDSLDSIYPKDEYGNIKHGEIISLDTTNSIIYSTEKLITTIGVKDLIIVSSEEGILVCYKECAQQVKYIVEKLNNLKKEKL